MNIAAEFFGAFSVNLPELTGQKTGTAEATAICDFFDWHLLQRQQIRDFFHAGMNDILCYRALKMLLK